MKIFWSLVDVRVCWWMFECLQWLLAEIFVFVSPDWIGESRSVWRKSSVEPCRATQSDDPTWLHIKQSILRRLRDTNCGFLCVISCRRLRHCLQDCGLIFNSTENCHRTIRNNFKMWYRSHSLEPFNFSDRCLKSINEKHWQKSYYFDPDCTK